MGEKNYPVLPVPETGSSDGAGSSGRRDASKAPRTKKTVSVDPGDIFFRSSGGPNYIKLIAGSDR